MTDRLEFKAALSVSDAGEITGIAWPFGSPDRVGDTIEKGAFTGPASLPMLFSHDHSQVIGVWNEITETPSGLEVKGRLLVDDVERAREVRAMVKAGAVSGLSIGFVTKGAKRHAKGRTISALELHEISIVAVPAHAGAQITSMKCIPVNHEVPVMENEQPAVQPTAPQIDTKAFDAVLARLDKIEAKSQRIGAPAIVQGDEEKPEQKAFVSFLQSGQIDQKALTIANDAPNHVLAPEEISSEFLRNLVEFSPIRAIADVRTTASETILLPKRTGITNAKWVGETTARTGSEPTFGQSEIKVKEIATFVDLSLQLAEDSTNVLSEITLALSEDFGQKEALSFVNGSEPTEPTGFMTAAGIAEALNGHAANLSPDALIALMYGLPATYRSAGTWVMNGNTLATLRTLKDGHGNYLWQPSYQVGQPETILGRPVVEAVDMPDIGEDETPIIFGDFKRGYRIYDRLSLAVLADPYTQRTDGMMRYHARRRVGADVVRPDAFRKLKMAV
ncbi:phage major capsid protein [Ketogulonicigenium vulgare]|uniref:phage major capsid protein n=1 Tax=Ketogulonicigenium vulgare TaxID=92945 RepID=UPI0023590C61|nr:phage major capsid protein [Ketogulonicigenium vulgare]